MGTAALDKVLGSPQQQGTTALDNVLGAALPKPTIIQPVGDESFLDTIGNIWKTTKAILTYQPSFQSFSQQMTDAKAAQQNLFQTAKIVGQNFMQFGSDMLDIASNPTLGNPALAKYTAPLAQGIQTGGVSGILKGIPTGIAQMPLDVLQAYTGLDRDPQTGSVIPIDPQKRAKAVQSTIAMVASGAVANKIMKVASLSNAELLGINNLSYPGALYKTAVPKLVSGAAAGGTFGAVKDIGDEGMLVSTIGNALAGAGIGFLHSVLTGESRELIKQVAENRGKSYEFTKAAGASLLATRQTQILDTDTPTDIAAKIQAIPLSNNEVDAAISANLTMGKMMVLDGIDRTTLDRLVAKYMPNTRASEGIYRPSPEITDKLAQTKFPVAGTKNQFVEPRDPFDKAVLASSQNPDILKDIQNQTGLSAPQIKSHRDYLINQIKQAPASVYTPRTDIELAHIAQDATDKGSAILNNTQDGQSFKDINGNQWLRTGNKVTNGQIAMSINDQRLPGILGTRASLDPDAQIYRMPKQNFSPEYGRELSKGTSIYSGPNDTHIVSSSPLADEPRQFFEKTGFMPNELVSYNGRPANVTGELNGGRVTITDISTGRNWKVSPNQLQRVPKGIDSEFYKADNGQQLTRMGILNRESYMDNLYKKFRDSHFDLDAEPQKAYNTTVQDFARSIGLKNQDDIADISRVFYSRMVNEVLDSDPELSEIHQRTLKNIQGWQKNLQDNRAANLAELFRSNNMSLTMRGGGIFDIRSGEDGRTVYSGKNFDDIMSYLQKSGISNGFDLDGGFTNGTPIIGGSLKDSWVPYTNPGILGKPGEWLSRVINAGKATPVLAMRMPAVKEFDKQLGTNFLPDFMATQHAQNVRANTATSNILKEYIRKSNDALEAGHDIEPLRRAELGASIYALTPDEIAKRFNLGPEQVTLASNIAKVGSGDVTDFIHSLQESVNYSKPIQSVEFQKILAKASGENPEIGTQAKLLLSIADGSSKPAGVLALANAIENGTGEVGSITKPERDYINAVKEAHQSLPGVSDPIFNNLYYSKLAEITGHNPFTGFSKDFLRTVNQWGSTPAGSLEIDPSTHLFNTRLSAINTAKAIRSNDAYFDGSNDVISFKNVVDKAQAKINSYSPKANDTPDILAKKSRQYAVVQYFQQYLDDVKGIPDLSTQIGKAMQQALADAHGVKTYNDPDLIRFGAALTYSSLLGARPAFAVRDLWNVYQNIAGFDSFEMANRVMGKSVSLSAAKELVDRGIIGNAKGLELLGPNESIIDGMGRLSKLAKGAAALSDLSTKFNGQQLAHLQASAGTYYAYVEKVGELSGKMLKNEISKKDAYTELKIQKLPEAEQKFFDDLVSAGKTQQAADFLARSHVDRFNTVYGRNNAPQAWRSWYGRLAGGFGQWATHQINTNIDMMGRGTNRQIISSNLKMGALNAAVMTAGIATGINLSRWMITPLSLPSQSPLLSGIQGFYTAAENSLSSDPSIGDPNAAKMKKYLPFYLDQNDEWQVNAAHLYLPMSYMAQDLINSYKMAQGDFGPSALAGFVGFSPIKSSVSPLQEAMGLQPEWQGKVVPEKSRTPKIFRMLNPFGEE